MSNNNGHVTLDLTWPIVIWTVLGLLGFFFWVVPLWLALLPLLIIGGIIVIFFVIFWPVFFYNWYKVTHGFHPHISVTLNGKQKNPHYHQ